MDIIGKVFEGRTIDRVSETANDLIEIGFTDNTFERVHKNDFVAFCTTLGVELPTPEAPEEPEADVETIVVTQEILDENPALADAGVEVGDVGFADADVPDVTE